MGFILPVKKNTYNSREPSNALLKAVLINGGQALLGVGNFKTIGTTYTSSPYDAAQRQE